LSDNEFLSDKIIKENTKIQLKKYNDEFINEINKTKFIENENNFNKIQYNIDENNNKNI